MFKPVVIHHFGHLEAAEAEKRTAGMLWLECLERFRRYRKNPSCTVVSSSLLCVKNDSTLCRTTCYSCYFAVLESEFHFSVVFVLPQQLWEAKGKEGRSKRQIKDCQVKHRKRTVSWGLYCPRPFHGILLGDRGLVLINDPCFNI